MQRGWDIKNAIRHNPKQNRHKLKKLVKSYKNVIRHNLKQNQHNNIIVLMTSVVKKVNKCEIFL